MTYAVQVARVGAVHASRQVVRNQTLHEEIDTESVHSLSDEALTQSDCVLPVCSELTYIDGSHVRPGVVCTQDARNVGLPELGTAFIDTNEFEGARAGVPCCRGGC